MKYAPKECGHGYRGGVSITGAVVEDEGRREEVLMAIDFSALFMAFLNSIIRGGGFQFDNSSVDCKVAIKISMKCCSSCHDTEKGGSVVTAIDIILSMGIEVCVLPSWTFNCLIFCQDPWLLQFNL